MMSASIPITDDGSVCNQGYVVRYKLGTDPSFTTLFPNPTESPIVINGLIDDEEYDLEVQRICCDGQLSTVTSTSFTATP